MNNKKTAFLYRPLNLAGYNPLIVWKDTLSCQAEGYAFVWLRFKENHLGLIVPPKFWKRQAFCKLPKWYKFFYKLLPLFRIDILATSKREQKWIFRVFLLGWSLGWLTKPVDLEFYPDAPSGLLVRHGLYEE